MNIIKKLKTHRKNNIISNKILKCVNFSPKDLLKERRENWSKGKRSHATIFGQREAALQIIEADIEEVHEMHDSHIYVITDFDMSEDGGCTYKNMSRYRKLQMMDRCVVYNFNILNDADFLEQIFSRRETESVWLYIIGANDEVCTKNVWRKIEQLVVVGRKYNVIVTLASACMNLKNDNLRTIVCSTDYFIFTPTQGIQPEDVRRVIDIQNISHLKYKKEYENAIILPVLVAIPIDELRNGYKTFCWFLQLNER